MKIAYWDPDRDRDVLSIVTQYTGGIDLPLGSDAKIEWGPLTPPTVGTRFYRADLCRNPAHCTCGVEHVLEPGRRRRH